jgi:hypothetical protein
MLLLLLRLTRECFCCFLFFSSGLLQMIEFSTLLWAARSREAFVKEKNVLAKQIRKISLWIWCWIGSTIGVDLFCWILLFVVLLAVCCLKRKAADWVVVFYSFLWVGTCFVFRHYCDLLLFVFLDCRRFVFLGCVFVFSFFFPWRESKTEDFIFDSVCNERVMW